MKILWLLILFSISLFSDTVKESAEKAYLANVNTALIFTSESGLSSGQYRFTKAGYRMENYALPFRFHLKPFRENMNLFINGGVGYSITRLDTQTQTTQANTEITLNHDNKLQTYAGGVGLGLRYRSAIGIDYLGSVGIIYSRVGTTINPNDEVGEAIKNFFDSNYNDNITYKFQLAADYEKMYKDYRLYLKGAYKLYETKADFTFDALSGFNTQSSVATVAMGVETPHLIRYEEDFLSLEPYVKFHSLQGDIIDVIEFNNYMNAGVVAYWNTPDFPAWAERFYLEVSTARAEGLEGYNIGLGFTLDY